MSEGAVQPVIVIGGPTASGKSAVADAVAWRLGSTVVSCDAMQVYRRMDIGTAKALPGECKAPLAMVDVADPDEAYSAALFQRDARAVIDRLLGEGRVPVLCGGTGLYIKAVIDEMHFPQGKLIDDRRAQLNDLAEKLGPEGLHKVLEDRDPAAAALIHPNNVRRVIRALEMLDEGRSYADQQAGFKTPQRHYRALQFALTRNREDLYRRIDERVDVMMEQGLLEEVRGLVDDGLGSDLTARQAIGYKELIDYLQGTCSLEEAVDLIKLRSRRYAKRQFSWFRRDERITWIDMDERSVDEAAEIVLNALAADQQER